jgi:hypothetical protein
MDIKHRLANARIALRMVQQEAAQEMVRMRSVGVKVSEIAVTFGVKRKHVWRVLLLDAERNMREMVDKHG